MSRQTIVAATGTADAEQAARLALLTAVRNHGLQILSWRSADEELRQRLVLLHDNLGDDWPDVSDAALLDRMDDWLTPFFTGAVSLAGLNDGSLTNGLLLLAGHPPAAQLDQLVPSHFSTPSGSRVQLSYGENKVVLSVRPQELFGLDQHPAILDGRFADGS